VRARAGDGTAAAYVLADNPQSVCLVTKASSAATWTKAWTQHFDEPVRGIADCSNPADPSTTVITVMLEARVVWRCCRSNAGVIEFPPRIKCVFAPGLTFLGAGVCHNGVLFCHVADAVGAQHVAGMDVPFALVGGRTRRRTVPLKYRRPCEGTALAIVDGASPAVVICGGHRRSEHFSIGVTGKPTSGVRMSSNLTSLRRPPDRTVAAVRSMPDGRVVVLYRHGGATLLGFCRPDGRAVREYPMASVEAPVGPVAVCPIGGIIAQNFTLTHVRMSNLEAQPPVAVIPAVIPVPDLTHATVGRVLEEVQVFNNQVAEAGLLQRPEPVIVEAASAATAIALDAADTALAAQRDALVDSNNASYLRRITALYDSAEALVRRLEMTNQWVKHDYQSQAAVLREARRKALGNCAEEVRRAILKQTDSRTKMASVRANALAIMAAAEGGGHTADHVADAIAEETKCPVCLELKGPSGHVAPCGHTMCRSCHNSVDAHGLGCPSCRGPLGVYHNVQFDCAERVCKKQRTYKADMAVSGAK